MNFIPAILGKENKENPHHHAPLLISVNPSLVISCLYKVCVRNKLLKQKCMLGIAIRSQDDGWSFRPFHFR